MVNTAFTETIGFLCRSIFWVICSFNVFLHWPKSFRPFVTNFRRSCNHCILRVHKNVMRKNKKWIFRKKYKFFIVLGDCKESFGGVVNTAFTEIIGTLCWSVFWIIYFLPFLYFERNNFGLSSTTLQRGCNHRILRVQRNVMRKNKKGFFEESISFMPFLETARKSSAGWSTLHSQRQGDIYADHFFKIYVFFTIFVLWAKHFRPFVDNSSARL